MKLWFKKWLLFLSLLIVGCSSEPIPSDLKLDNTNKHLFVFEWESNQIEPYMNLVIYPIDGSKTISINNIQSKHFERELTNGDAFTVYVGNKGAVAKPECYLAISRYKPMNLQSGAYNPDELELLYEQEASSNSTGVSTFINKEGKIN